MLKPHGLYTLVQFRDIKGTNYQQMYWFFYEAAKDTKTPGTYRLGSLDPVVPVETKRMEFQQRIEFEKIRSVPKYLMELAKFWNASISSGTLKQNRFTHVEDRGKGETI